MELVPQHPDAYRIGSHAAGYLDTLTALTDGVGPDVILEIARINLENDMRKTVMTTWAYCHHRHGQP